MFVNHVLAQKNRSVCVSLALFSNRQVTNDQGFFFSDFCLTPGFPGHLSPAMRWIHISLSLASRGDEPEAVSLGETEVTDLSARCEDPEDFSICPELQNLGCFLSKYLGTQN